MQTEDFETFVKADVMQKQREYWAVWQTKSDNEKLQLTLLPADGR